MTDALREAIRPSSTAISHTIQTRTRSGESKLVEVYLRRLNLPSSEPILASIHSELTVSSDSQWIDRTVLQKLQAFVFVKRWDEAKGEFVFAHMNQLNADALGLRNGRDAEGLSDKNFFDDPVQRKVYEDDDNLVSKGDERRVMIREEAFFPRNAKAMCRILTFKTPFCPPSSKVVAERRMVLGISFDVTSVTDLLREVSEKAKNGLYINCLLYTSPSPRD